MCRAALHNNFHSSTLTAEWFPKQFKSLVYNACSVTINGLETLKHQCHSAYRGSTAETDASKTHFQLLPSRLSLFALASTGCLGRGLIPVRECHAAHKPKWEINPPHNLLIANFLLHCFQVCCGKKQNRQRAYLALQGQHQQSLYLASRRRFPLKAEENYYPGSSSPFYLGLLVWFFFN